MSNMQIKMENSKEIFSAKVVSFDIENGNGHIVMLNAEQADKYWIKNGDKISLIRKREEFVVDVALTDKYVQANEIWVTNDFLEEYPIMHGDTVLISFVKNNPQTPLKKNNWWRNWCNYWRYKR